MKNPRITRLLVFGVPVLFFGLALQSCSNSDLRRQFAMEKAMDDANRIKQEYHISDGVISEREAADLEKKYLSIARMVSAPPKDSTAVANSPEPLRISWQLAGLAYYNLGLLAMEQENYQTGYQFFAMFIELYSPKSRRLRRAIFMQAIAMYKMYRYKEAIILYNWVARDYSSIPESPIDPNLDLLESPLTAARTYLETNDRNRFTNQVSTAIDFYLDIISIYDDTPLAEDAAGKLAALFLLGDMADSAVAVLGAVTDPETDKVPALNRLNMGTIQRNQLRDYRAAEQNYRKLIEDYPDDSLAISAQLGIGISLYYQKKYEKARYELSLVNNYQSAPSELVAEARYLTAVCFEDEGKWDRALGEYDFVWTDHATDRKGIGIPAHKAEHYLNTGEGELAAQAFAEAENDYKRLEDTYAARPAIASSAMAYLIRCYILQNKWDVAAETLRTLSVKYPRTPSGYSALPQAANILAKKLDKPSEALELLKLYLRKYPESPVKYRIATLADSLESSIR